MPKENFSMFFWGTPEFALPALNALKKANFLISGIVTNPDEKKGRKLAIAPPPVKKWALENNVPVFQPESLKKEYFSARPEEEKKILSALKTADLFLVVSYGKIIPKKFLKIPPWGVLNIHPSLLPRWRGPSPIQYAILAGDSETGVTIMKIDEEMDHGPILAQKKFLISANTNYPELHDKLADLGAELLIETLPKYLAGKIRPKEQNHEEAVYSRILEKKDGHIDWSLSAVEIENKIRALTPWPSCWTVWKKNKKESRLRVDKAVIFSLSLSSGKPGLVSAGEGKLLLVCTGQGRLEIKKLTLEGKKTMDAKDFLAGNKDIIGSYLT